MGDTVRERAQSEEQRIDLISILRDLLRDWWMIVTAGLAGAMLAYMFLAVVYTPRYTSSATLIVSAKGAANAAVSDLSVTSSLAENFSTVLDSAILKKKVQEELGLDSFPGQVEAAVIPETNMLTLRVTAGSPQTAFELIRSILNNYSEITDYAMDNVVLGVLDAPAVPMSASNPMQKDAVVKKAFLAGAALMTALLALLSHFRDNVKNEKEVEQKLDTKLFASVYHEKKYKSLRQALRARVDRRKKSVTILDPTTSFSFVETFKKIRTKLIYRAQKEQSRVILVTSVMENEGKSTVAVNLALALAQKSSRVLLLDGDLRRPAVHKILEMEIRPNQEVGSYLTGKRGFNQLLTWDEKRKLFVIGGRKRYANSTEIISGERTKRLLEVTRRAMDYVVIDSPPMALMADAEVLAEYADLSLLVVKQGVARTRDINDAIDVLENSGSKLLGCIYNDVRTGVFSGRKSWGYGYGYGYGYRYGYGYGRYHRYGYGAYGRYGYGTADLPETGADAADDRQREEQD